MYHIVHVYLYTHLRMHGCCLAPTTIPNQDKSMSIDVLLFSFCCVLLCLVLHVCCCFFGWLRATEAYLWCAKYGTLVCWLYVDAWHIICVTWRRVMAESVWALHCDPHLVGQLAVAAYSCVVAHFSLGCVHTSPTPAVDFTSSAQLSALHASLVPSLGKAQSSSMVNRRIKI